MRFPTLALCGLLLAGLLAGSPAVAAPDPAYMPITDDARLPRVLLIGDSISVGYTLPVRGRLAGKANVHRIPVNGATTTNGLAHLDAWLGTNRWDVIHFNWGLHDLKIAPSGNHFTPLPEYERNLDRLVTRLQATGAALIWASTTPVPPGKLSPPRKPGDDVEFNKAAARVMARHGVAVNDLYALAAPRVKEWQLRANVHFTAGGSDALAEAVAKAIARALEERARPGNGKR